MHWYNLKAFGRVYKISGIRKIVLLKNFRFLIVRIIRKLWFTLRKKHPVIILFTNIEIPVPNVSLAIYVNLKYVAYFKVNGIPYRAKTNFIFLNNMDNSKQLELTVFGYGKPITKVLELNYAEPKIPRLNLKALKSFENLEMENLLPKLALRLSHNLPNYKLKSQGLSVKNNANKMISPNCTLDLNENLFYQILNQTYYEHSSKTN